MIYAAVAPVISNWLLRYANDHGIKKGSVRRIRKRTMITG